jgi:hypothetical protein
VPQTNKLFSTDVTAENARFGMKRIQIQQILLEKPVVAQKLKKFQTTLWKPKYRVNKVLSPEPD